MHAAVELHPTRHSQRILQIVDGIYAAACGERPWERTLAEICQIGKLDGCALSVVDPLERRRVVLACCGLNSAAEPDTRPGPMPGNPQLPDGILRSTPGAIWHDRQIRSDARLTTMSYWADWMQSDGLLSWACVVVGRDGRQVTCLEVYAGARCASSCPELDNLLRQLAPHLTRAWRLGRAARSNLAARSGAASSPHSHTHAAPDPDLAALPGMARLRADFGLTKAEARLALRLAEGSSLASAAQAFNVKLTTIRSQLQQVFAKTGTSARRNSWPCS
jgi:DNA-binding CsgD family transcriptional regulator